MGNNCFKLYIKKQNHDFDFGVHLEYIILCYDDNDDNDNKLYDDNVLSRVMTDRWKKDWEILISAETYWGNPIFNLLGKQTHSAE